MAETLRADASDAATRAVHALDEGALIVYPANGRYALGADALDEDAVERAFEAKNRPADDAMSVVVADLEEARHVAHVTPLARRLAASLLPGLVTLALRSRPTAPSTLLGGRDVIWVRVPSEPLAREIAARHGPITATAATFHGKGDALTLDEARAALKEKVRLYLDAGTLAGMTSTVVDCTGEAPRVLAAGTTSPDEIIRAASR